MLWALKCRPLLLLWWMHGLKTGLLLSTSPSFFTAGDILINDVLIVWKQVAHTHMHGNTDEHMHTQLEANWCRHACKLLLCEAIRFPRRFPNFPCSTQRKMPKRFDRSFQMIGHTQSWQNNINSSTKNENNIISIIKMDWETEKFLKINLSSIADFLLYICT